MTEHIHNYKFSPPSGGWPTFNQEGKLLKPRVYVAGPMRGIPLYNFPAFAAASDSLRLHGWEAVSPAQMDLDVGFDPNDESVEFTSADFALAMRRDIEALLTVDAIALMEGWEASTGANIELTVARALGLQVMEFTSIGLNPESQAQPNGKALKAAYLDGYNGGLADGQPGAYERGYEIGQNNGYDNGYYDGRIDTTGLPA